MAWPTSRRTARTALHLEVLNWSALVQAAAQPLQAQHPQVEWVLPDQPVWVMADADSLRSAMQALLDNAVKFSATQPQPQVCVEAQPLAAGGWRLTVQDNGVGFDASRAQGLGELFQRMHRREASLPVWAVAWRWCTRWRSAMAPAGRCSRKCKPAAPCTWTGRSLFDCASNRPLTLI